MIASSATSGQGTHNKFYKAQQERHLRQGDRQAGHTPKVLVEHSMSGNYHSLRGCLMQGDP